MLYIEHRYYCHQQQQQHHQIIRIFLDHLSCAWFRAKDIFPIIGYINTHKTLIHVDVSDQCEWSHLNVNVPIDFDPTSIFINENGLEQLILHSYTSKSNALRIRLGKMLIYCRKIDTHM